MSNCNRSYHCIIRRAYTYGQGLCTSIRGYLLAQPLDLLRWAACMHPMPHLAGCALLIQTQWGSRFRFPSSVHRRAVAYEGSRTRPLLILCELAGCLSNCTLCPCNALSLVIGQAHMNSLRCFSTSPTRYREPVTSTCTPKEPHSALYCVEQA